MANAPQFTATPRAALEQVSTANTNRDGSGTLQSIITGVAAGTKIQEVIIQATGTTTAGMVRLYLSSNSGSTSRLFDEFVISAITVGASTAGFRVSRTYDNLILPSASWILRASTHNAETFNIIALGADL
jgi:hypothetical protein